MPQFATITLPAPTTTVDDMVFNPLRRENGVAFYGDKTYNGNNFGVNLTPVISISNQIPSKNSKLQKMRLKLVLPEPARDSTNTRTNVKDYESLLDISISIPEKASLEHRETIAGALREIGKLTTLLNAMIVNGESIYA